LEYISNVDGTSNPVKINAVVMDGKNIDDIISLVELTKQYPRFRSLY
jgi:molybdenum cofactor biosynthesis enzyme MoaA